MGQRVLALEGAINFRDMGGYKTADGQQLKWQTLYRCGKLDQLSATAVSKVISLGIKSVVDFRFPEEVGKFPTPVAAFPDADFFHWQSRRDPNKAVGQSWLEIIESNTPDQLSDFFAEKYIIYLSSHAEIYARMLEQLATQQTPLVFHCAAGKDRTGLAAMLILSLLGVERATILEDYLLTQELLGKKIENWALGGAVLDDQYKELINIADQIPYEKLKPLFAADEKYLNHCWSHIDAEYGDVENYAREKLGVTDPMISDLKKNLLI